ncbi:uncharacterized protein LOC125235631 [Leguminivora glycinivorella]|uniref:uncharacterized protein LOC125235631 n=1 Tax=Leguminivora glycinivorella TaxID=1035111 RepID=UPI00200DB025|nr:uncharacterized protein LOC125235631 [Leguminivora glycinivorella]
MSKTVTGSGLMMETLTVASKLDCLTVLQEDHNEDYVWRETQVGCKVLLLLQEMLRFNITYISKVSINDVDGVDIFAKPHSLWSTVGSNCAPIAPILDWKFGYILRRPSSEPQHFYSLSFSATVWQFVVAMTLLVSVLFYILNRAEQKLAGENLRCYFWNEFLIALGIICQHYISINVMELSSRRIAFISFFLFSYIIHCHYTSTLLSDLVHDRDNDMDLGTLSDSDYEHVVLDTVASIIQVIVDQLGDKNNKMSPQRMSYVQKNLINIRVVNISAGLEEVKMGKSALLSDYVSLFPAAIKSFTKEEACDFINVDMISHVLKYLVASKNFKYTEEFKMSTLRAHETGILQRLLSPYRTPVLHTCVSSLQAHIGLVRNPLILLACCYVLCGLMLVAERMHYKRYKVWPYVN